ncbi:XRE family transcriptional regulator [Actinoplanes sp. NPDC026619]|uniref:XRE family transcriptional regulator n=1 Tax=Actinoplanes sp. NPDC026619 TaxID=3155798 RepID=UPI0033DFEF54
MTLAGKINLLFATQLRSDGKPYSNDEVAAKMSELGDRISGAYLSSLRRGIQVNPTKNVLASLAAFFSRSPAYFFDDAESRAIADEFHVLNLLADAGVRRIATRFADLSPSLREHLLAIAEHMIAIQETDPKTSAHQNDG